jgi:hypothetical protein
VGSNGASSSGSSSNARATSVNAAAATSMIGPSAPVATGAPVLPVAGVSSGGVLLPGARQVQQPKQAPMTGREIEEAAMQRCIELQLRHPNGVPMPRRAWGGSLLEEAYERCGEVTSEYAKTFYLGTQLMTPKQARAIWAIYVWCRRTDELVDGPNASRITPKVGGAWEWRGAPLSLTGWASGWALPHAGARALARDGC